MHLQRVMNCEASTLSVQMMLRMETAIFTAAGAVGGTAVCEHFDVAGCT